MKESIKTFKKLVKLVFKSWKVFNILFLFHIYKLLKIYLANSLYLVKNIKATLKKVFGINRSILDSLYITSINTRIDLPITIIYKLLNCIFTNYNNIESRE
jgi:hypothetical protein